MRHRTKTVKLGRTSQHRDLMLGNMAASLIKHNRIETTLAKAKALRPIAEKLVTLGKKGTLHHRRLAIARIGDLDAVTKLFADIAPRFKERQGGYTRILKLGYRPTDAAEAALIEWVDFVVPVTAKAAKEEAKADAAEGEAKEKKAKAPRASKKKKEEGES
jgi:large subunit ribosomal protein L17